MTQNGAKTWIGILGFLVVALVIAIVVILCAHNGEEAAVESAVLSGENIETAVESDTASFGDYAEDASLELSNSPIAPEAGY